MGNRHLRIRHALGLVTLLLSLMSAQAAPANPTRVAGFGGQLVVDPSTVAAGGTVSVSGQCSNGTPDRVQIEVFRLVGEGLIGPPSLSGGRTIQPAADMSFVTEVAIPVEATPGTWRIIANCALDDMVLDHDTAAIDVTGPALPPPTMTLASTVVAGDSLQVDGAGCIAEELSLETVVVRISAETLGEPPNQLATAEGAIVNGSWSVFVPIPADWNHRTSFVSATCRTATEAPSGMIWQWHLPSRVTVLPPLPVLPPPMPMIPATPLARTG